MYLSCKFTIAQIIPVCCHISRCCSDGVMFVWEEIDVALSELPQEQREVFCLTVFDGMSVKVISTATDILAEAGDPYALSAWLRQGEIQVAH